LQRDVEKHIYSERSAFQEYVYCKLYKHF